MGTSLPLDQLKESDAGTAPDARVISIRRSASSWDLSLHSIWEYRELLYFLTWRDIKVRYKQTVLGVAWAIIQPLFLALTLTLFLGRWAKLPSDGVPYLLFVYAAMVPWQLFEHGLSQSSNSIVMNERLITKVYFPRLLVPLSAVLEGMVDLIMASVVLLALLAHYWIVPTAKLLSLPLFVGLAALIAFGAGLWLSALNVQYRDVRYTLGFLTQLWFFATPVAYPASIVPEHWRAWYGINPMVGVVEGFRWALFGAPQAPTRLLAMSAFATAVILIGGLFYFQRMEDTFADII